LIDEWLGQDIRSASREPIHDGPATFAKFRVLAVQPFA
jgi:hypothetical protein